MNTASRQRNRLLVLITTAILLFSMILPIAAGAKDQDQTDKGSQANKLQMLVDKMQPGWNLGNTLDSVGDDETAWGNPRVTKQLFFQIKLQGFNSVRIPVTWQNHMGDGPDYKIDPAYMDRVEQVVDYALDEGLYVVIDMHHDSWLWVNKLGTDEHDQVLARYSAAWTQIADRFKDHSDRLLFESINEPRFGDGWDTDKPEYSTLLDELNTAFVHIVRQSGSHNADRALVLPAVATSSSQVALDGLSKTISKLNDPNIVATFHYYGFWPFSVNIAGTTTFDQATRDDLTQTFDRMHDMFIAKGIPVILGEYGLLGFDISTDTIEQGEKLKYFAFLADYARQQDITTMLWDNGQHFNRHTYEWNDPELYKTLKDSWRTVLSTTDSDLVFVPKSKEVQDAAVKLNLNGNRLVYLDTSGEVLHKDKDYTLDGDTLTLKASLLKRLTSSGQYGENHVVTLNFNNVAEWNLHILLADAPTLANAEGTTDAFAIPAAFNGDPLATMEAVYEDGTNAGPQNWTPYKQFGSDFSPSYDTNEIKLLPAFFKEVKDGKVTLKFHFWSGTVLSYTITKDGTSVVGVNN